MNTPPSASEQFHDLIDEEWELRMKEDPLFATSTGDNRYNDRLPAASDADFTRRMAELAAIRARQDGIDRSALSPEDQLNYDIFARLLDNEINEIRLHGHRLPISKTGGFHIYFPDLPQYTPFESEGDYENYITRLSAFREYAAGHIDLMRAGLAGGQIPPRVTLEDVDKMIRTQVLGEANNSPLFEPFKNFPKNFPGERQKKLSEAGKKAILGSVRQGFQDTLDFFLGEYLPAAREDIAAANLPDGKEFYRHRIRMFTSLDLSAEEIHNIGMEEVKRIRSESQAVIRKAGFTGDFKAFIEFLRTDPRFYAETPEQLLQKTALVLKRIDGELPRLFKTLPRLPYGIKEIPAFAAPGSTTAYYFPGTGDGTKAGNYYVNTYDLKSRPLYEIEALSLHEAVPGHHLQIALQQELELPNFRRFNGFTSFIEGWALYSERLGLEMGFYQDPYSDFGRLSYEMWRACRLVVDTGMHALDWTRQQAIDFMLENTSSTLLNIVNEVDRYIAWPGQALAYKLGEIKIRELRQVAENALGAKFDLREFHDAILLQGAVPLDVLEQMVNTWVAASQ